MSTTPEQALLECRNLNTRYREVQVLHDINLRFQPGEFTALLGKNGAGKTTLLSSLLGIVPSTFQHLAIGGLNPLQANRAEIARQVSYVSQDHDDMFPFSVLEVVVMGRTARLGPFGAPSRADFEDSRKILEELHITHLAKRVYTTLSGGEKQLVLLARALVQTRVMVFLDEPTNHLDYKNRYRILASLKQQCQNNRTCVVACLHDPSHAMLFADQVILLEKGRIIAQGPSRDVMTGERISRLYGLPVHIKGNSVEPSFSRPSFAAKVLLLVGSSGAGKTTVLQQAVHKSQSSKKIDGILCPGTWKNDKRYSSTAVRIATGEQAPFTRRKEKNGDGPFIFFPEGARLAETALAAEHHTDTDCIIIDEVGPKELKDEGFAPLLAPLLSLEHPKHIWAVRPSIVEHVCSKWLLVDPVIVDAAEENAIQKIQDFIQSPSEQRT